MIYSKNSKIETMRVSIVVMFVPTRNQLKGYIIDLLITLYPNFRVVFTIQYTLYQLRV
jgi:hypothetical protein